MEPRETIFRETIQYDTVMVVTIIYCNKTVIYVCQNPKSAQPGK